MRAAFIGADGVLRDAEGQRVVREGRPMPPRMTPRRVRRHPRLNAATRQQAAAVLRSPYLGAVPTLPEEAEAPAPPTTVSPARKLADQVGVSASAFSFSHQIGNPETQIYPGRIVFQKEDPMSLYVVSMRTPEREGWIKLFKLEGVARGRWFERPLQRAADEKGEMLPGLLSDFMAVPHQWTAMVWSYVLPVPPIFEDEEAANYERVSPEGIAATFVTAEAALEEIPADTTAITTETLFSKVIENAGTALIGALAGVDVAGAAYDDLKIGLNALRLYQKVGRDLIKGVNTLLDIAYEAYDNPARMGELSAKVVELRNRLVGAEELYAAYMARAELYTQWNMSIQYTHWQDMQFELRNMMGELVPFIDQNRDQILARGVSVDNLESIRAISVAGIRRYDRNDGAFENVLYNTILAGEEGGDLSDLYSLNYVFPALLRENTATIKNYRQMADKVSPTQEARLISIYRLAGYTPFGAEPPTSFKALLGSAIEAFKNAVKIKVGQLRQNFRNNYAAKAERLFLRPVQNVTNKLIERRGIKIKNLTEEGYLQTAELIERERVLREEASRIKDANPTHAKNLLAEAENLRKQYEPNILSKKVPASEQLTLYYKLLEPRFKAAKKPIADRVAAELEILTNMVEGPQIIKTFNASAHKDFAELMYALRDVGPAPEYWRSVIEMLINRSGSPWNFKKMIEQAEAKMFENAEILGLSKADRHVLEDLTGRLLRKETVAEAEYKRLFPKAKTAKGSPPGSANSAQIRKLIDSSVIWRFFRDKLKEMETLDVASVNVAGAAGRAAVVFDEAEQAVARNQSYTMNLKSWNEIRKGLDEVTSAFPTDATGKPMAAETGIGARVANMLKEGSDSNKALRLTERGREWEKMMAEKRESLAKDAKRLNDLLGINYGAFEKLASEKPGVTKEAAELAKKLMEEYKIFVDDVQKVIEPSIQAKRGLLIRPIRKALEILSKLFSVKDGITADFVRQAKDLGGVGSVLLGIPSALAGVLQLLLALGGLAILGFGGAGALEGLLKGFVGTLSGWFGGDPDQSQNPPGAVPTRASGFLPFLGFAMAIAMIAYGKPFFDAVGKVVGGLFQFATALLPSSAKKKGKGAPGAPGKRGAGRPIDVLDWAEKLEAAKHRLSEAKNDAQKRAAERDIERIKEKLKKAKDEGLDVPEGLIDGFWGFNWLG